MKEMKENNIDITQLVEYKTDHCRRAEPSTAVFPNLFDVAVPLTSLFTSHGTP